MFEVVGFTTRAPFRDNRTDSLAPWITSPLVGDRMLILAGELGRVAAVVAGPVGPPSPSPPHAVTVTTTSSAAAINLPLIRSPPYLMF
jgi:hypothetical protein